MFGLKKKLKLIAYSHVNSVTRIDKLSVSISSDLEGQS